jgi:hypothetical protein
MAANARAALPPNKYGICLLAPRDPVTGNYTFGLSTPMYDPPPGASTINNERMWDLRMYPIGHDVAAFNDAIMHSEVTVLIPPWHMAQI